MKKTKQLPKPPTNLLLVCAFVNLALMRKLQRQSAGQKLKNFKSRSKKPIDTATELLR